MSEPAAAPIVSTEPYVVTEVAGHVPVVLDDFVGATTVSVQGDEREFRLKGAGRWEGQAVEFHEKETASASADPPIWKFVVQGEGHIVVEPPTS